MFVKGENKSPKEDEFLDANLRPQSWGEYIGQLRLKNNLRVIIDAARKRKEPLEHLLFYGNSGLGKTTLAHVVANEMGTQIHTCSGPSLERAGDVASLLSNLEDGEILFIDECHRVAKSIIEMLYSAMEDYQLHIVLGKGLMARTMELDLPKFTLIAATTRMALLPSPLRNRFGATFQLNFYEEGDVEDIIKRSARILKIELDPEVTEMIAQRSRLTPRVANRILKRVRDFATVEGSPRITKPIAQKAFEFLEIDSLGLEPADRKILSTVIERFDGGPVGIEALGAAAAEEEDTILDLYEPYLMQLGFLERTPRGRVVAKRAYEHLGIPFRRGDLL